MSDIKHLVRTYIIENFLFGQEDGLRDDTSFLRQGVLDSTGVLELVTFLEKTFAITVLDDDMLPENLDSFNAIEAFVMRKAPAQPPADQPDPSCPVAPR